jgi:hypothetical protein
VTWEQFEVNYRSVWPEEQAHIGGHRSRESFPWVIQILVCDAARCAGDDSKILAVPTIYATVKCDLTKSFNRSLCRFVGISIPGLTEDRIKPSEIVDRMANETYHRGHL